MRKKQKITSEYTRTPGSPALEMSNDSISISTNMDGDIVFTSNDSYVDSVISNATDGKAWNPEEGVFNLDIMTRFFLSEMIERCGDYDRPAVKRLAEIVVAHAKHVDDTLRKRCEDGMIDFFDIPFFFDKGSEVVFNDDGITVGGTVESVTLQHGFYGKYYAVVARVIENRNGQTDMSMVTNNIYYYDGARDVSKMPVRPITPAIKAKLTERGRHFVEVTAQSSMYLSYTGHMIRRGWFIDSTYRADGRIMIDSKMMNIMDNDYGRYLRPKFKGANKYDDDDDGRTADVFTVPEESLWMCWPFVYGFSFKTKKWGDFYVDNISEIKFREDAFDNLVLDHSKKKLVRALVEHSDDNNFTDLIDGKGGGCIFLLHGEPGVGKTLTAEAVAEVLKRPLYMVSVGELGTDPGALEESLQQILDLCQAWNAVILLDEADIFLEARDEKDIVRNAMVGVFLRLLEYHQGVMFLTSNRVRNFDPAFHSRISIALKYDAMNTSTREKIWTNLLAKAQIDGVDIEALARHDVNGRQIKNSIRQAITLAKSEKTDVTTAHIQMTLDLIDVFRKQIG